MDRSRPAHRSWWRSLATLLIVITPVAALVLTFGRDWRRSSWHDPRLNSPYRNTRPDVKYVGDQSCAECHAQISSSYHQHSMGRSMALAADSPLPGLDQKTSRHEFEAQGLFYAIERRDGRVIHSETKKDSEGKLLTRVEAEVTYAVGSGHRGRSYLIERDGFITQSPISWYSQQGRWDLSPDALVKNSHFERPVDASCLFCHSNLFDPLPGTINGYKSPTFRGMAIGCERCHGPGELHLKTPGIGPDGIDPTIVNPRKLDTTSRESVCEQCHLAGRSRIERLGTGVRDYRPGTDLSDFLAVFVDRKPAQGEARSIGHIEQMRASRCYQETNGQLSCTSCHDPHSLPAENERTAFYRARCLDCHSSGNACRLPEQERRQKSRNDSCIECHMPRSSLLNIAHTAETNHGIPRHGQAESQSPVIADSRKNAEVPLVASVSTRAGMETDSTVEARFDRELGIALAGFGAESHSDRARLARIAMPLLDAALKRRPDDLVAWQSKVVAFTLRGQNKEAFEAARSAIALAPNDERTLALSFPFVAAEGGANEAIEVGKRLLSISPHVSKYQLLMAQILARHGRWSEAVDACREALRNDPLNLTARHILVKSALEMKDFATARTEADIYLRFELNPADRRAILKSLETAR